MIRRGVDRLGETVREPGKGRDEQRPAYAIASSARFGASQRSASASGIPFRAA